MAEVISIQSLPAPSPHQGDSRSQRWVGGPLHVWYGRPHLATDWLCCIRFPDLPLIMEWWGSKCRFWACRSAKIGFFRPSVF